MNKVILTGNLGQDATAQTFNEKQVINFSLAVQDNFKNGQGEWVDRVIWFNITMWSSRPITRLVKGAKVIVEGKVRHESYKDKNGVERWQIKVTAESIEIMSSPVQGNTYHEPSQPPQPMVDQRQTPAKETSDDLPF
jgi:single-strand DNA-binding protein